jgi:uncharacterized membrane protein
MFLTWKALHVLSMVTMVTAFIGVEIFYAAAIWRRDVRALAFVHRTVEKIGVGFVALGALAAGVVFGLLAAADGGFDFVAGWLIAAYVLIAAFLVNASLIGAKVVEAGKAAIEADEGRRPIEDVARDLVANRGVILVVINIVIFGAVILDMVLKPF